jgi:thiol-disulfide isomerase/thioredoxin
MTHPPRRPRKFLPVALLALFPGVLAGCGGDPAPAAPTLEAAPVLAAATSKPTSAAPSVSAVTGQAAPPLSLLPVGGGPMWTLDDVLDPSGGSCPDAYLVAFMASWCTYCTQSLPTLVELQEEFPDLGIVTVTIDDRPDAQAAEASKVQAAGLTGPVLVADASTRATWLGPRGSVPRYFFVDHDGKVRAQDSGFGDKVRPMMPAQARRALGKLPGNLDATGDE